MAIAAEGADRGLTGGSQLARLEVALTDLHWFPAAARRGGASMDVVAVADASGGVRILQKSGRVEKEWDNAHTGATVALKWSPDGSALATCGEDGAVKVWSRSGMLRSTLVQASTAIYSLAWSPASEQVLFCTGPYLVIKPMQPGSKQIQWKAHEGVVLTVDWNPVNNMIVSGGEDMKYKVWDAFGRLLFSSSFLDHVVTAVAWCPDGEMFAVGSYNLLLLCDKTGWNYSKESLDVGSVMSVSWTNDGTQVVGGCGNGSVIFADVANRSLEWDNTSVELRESTKIIVKQVSGTSSELTEELDFRDRVVKMSLGHNYLVVATSSQCCIYHSSNWNTPHIFDFKDPVSLILQSEKNFLTVDHFSGIQIFSYEGRQVSNPKFQGLQTELMNKKMINLANDCVAVVDSSNKKKIRFFNIATGKALGEELEQTTEIVELSLNHCGGIEDRRVVFCDRNKDLFISPITATHVVKLATMVDSMMWQENCNVLAAIADKALCMWCYPDIVYTDRELIAETKVICDGVTFGQSPEIVNFSGSRCTVRRNNGARVLASVPQFPMTLHALVRGLKWDKATRLCRFVKDRCLWACLAAMAITTKELHTAEVAYAALDEIDKVQWINYVKAVPTEEGRSAEIALFCRRRQDAEAILIQAGLFYRAIEMNARLFQWDRALELAVAHKTHLDTVLWLRKKYLAMSGKEETHEKFTHYNDQVELNEEEITAKVQQEEEKELQRPGARRYA